MNNMMRSVGFVTGIFLAFPVAAEPVPGTGLSLNLESAQIVGTGRSINMHRVPLTNIATGRTTYKDVVARFSLDINGNLIFQNVSSQTVSPPLNASNFIPGTYVGAQGNTYILSGPAQVGATRTAWTLICADCIVSMNWTTGSPVGHPDIGSRPIAQQLAPGFSYGIAGENGSGDEFSLGYGVGDLIGARQIGNTLTVALFNRGGIDVNTSTASVALRLQTRADGGPPSLPPPPPGS